MAATETVAGCNAYGGETSAIATATTESGSKTLDSVSNATSSCVDGETSTDGTRTDQKPQSGLKQEAGNDKSVKHIPRSASSQQEKGGPDMSRHGTHLNVKPGVEKEACQSNDVIGATIAFGLGQNSLVTSGAKDKPKNDKKKTNSSILPSSEKKSSIGGDALPRKSGVTNNSPHSPKKLLESAVTLLDNSKFPESSTCPKPAYIDSLSDNRVGAVALNDVSSTRDCNHVADSAKNSEPVERELQPLPKRDDEETVGLFKDRKIPNNYGSIDSPDIAAAVVASSSGKACAAAPEEEPTLPTRNGATKSQDDPGGAAGAFGVEEPTKKKKKRKKKKKGNTDTDGAGANSDHETKQLTSPGTSGAEDSTSKPSIPEPTPLPAPHTAPQPSPKQQGNPPLNGPAITQAAKAPASSNKTKKMDNKTDNSTKKQTNNTKRNTDAADDAKSQVKPDKLGGSKLGVKSDMPKSLDVQNMNDGLRTTCTDKGNSEHGKIVVKSGKLDEVEKVEPKKGVASDNESESGNDAEKSSEDTNPKASQESSVDESIPDEDESNGYEWQTYGVKKSKRRALAFEDRYNNIRPSPTDNFRRSHYSGPFDPRLRKSSSEPSGMSKWNDASETSRPVQRHSSFSRHPNWRDDFQRADTSESGPASETVEKPPVPVSANSYAAKLKAKPPVAPNGPSKKTQEGPASVGEHVDSNGKPDKSKSVPLDSSMDSGDQEESDLKNAIETKSTTSSATGELDSQGDLTDVPAKVYLTGAVSAATAAKSASLPRDMGRLQGTELPKMDNTSADNVVQYLDLQCSNDTYASRLKQSIPKPADAKSSSKASIGNEEKPVASDSVKPQRVSKLESSHKAVSLDSAQPVPAGVPKKYSSTNSKDKDSMRSVKSETSLNLTSDGNPVIQDNSFPFEAEPASIFDITFGSVKFSESDFELIDDMSQTSQYSKPDSTAPQSVPRPVPAPSQQDHALTKPPPPQAKQLSCAELEKKWIARDPQSDPKRDNVDRKVGSDTHSTVRSVSPSLAMLLAGGNLHSAPLARVGENNNLKKRPVDQAYTPSYWASRFNHSELAGMLLSDWEKLNCELTKQSSKIVVYEED